MDNNTFNRLSTNKIPERLRPYIDAVYSNVFPGCTVRTDATLHEDRDLGIDTFVELKTKSIITFQEKCRKFEDYHFKDFTQEYMNAVGIPYEHPGEWFKFIANFYFYGWENATQDGFHQWVIFDVVRYKLLIEKYGGLSKVGILKSNQKHGKANFYAIPMRILEPACSWR